MEIKRYKMKAPTRFSLILSIIAIIISTMVFIFVLGVMSNELQMIDGKITWVHTEIRETYIGQPTSEVWHTVVVVDGVEVSDGD